MIHRKAPAEELFFQYGLTSFLVTLKWNCMLNIGLIKLQAVYLLTRILSDTLLINANFGHSTYIYLTLINVASLQIIFSALICISTEKRL